MLDYGQESCYGQGYTRLLVVSSPYPPFSVALDVLHHQHIEGRVWKLLHGSRVRQECN